jgi:hypothetical protein
VHIGFFEKHVTDSESIRRSPVPHFHLIFYVITTRHIVSGIDGACLIGSVEFNSLIKCRALIHNLLWCWILIIVSSD